MGESTRFLDAVVVRGAAVYRDSGERTRTAGTDENAGEKTGRNTDENVGKSKDSKNEGDAARASAPRGEMLGSVSDLVACHGREGVGAAGAAEGCPVKVLVQLVSGAPATARESGATLAASSTLVAVPLEELTWHADGRYFSCAKNREALLGSDKREVADAGHRGGPGGEGSERNGNECKFSDLAMAPLASTDGATGRVATLVLDCRASRLSHVLASGFGGKKAAAASSERSASTEDAGGQRKGEVALTTSTGSGTIVLPFSVLQFESAPQTGGGPARTPRLSVPMTASALAGAPELVAAKLSQLADPAFAQKVTAFYAAARR